MPTQPETVPAQLEALLGEHFADAARFCRFLAGGEAAGRELLADATALAALHIRQLRKPDRFRQWFYAIIRNRFRTAYRRRRAVSHLDDAMLLSACETPEERMETALVDSALATLPEGERAAVVLHYIEGLPVGEVARVLGISSPAVKTRLHRARRRLEPIMRMLLGVAQPAPAGGTIHED
jgi:RNA polymerase sigma factor (sigma-70 family)